MCNCQSAEPVEICTCQSVDRGHLPGYAMRNISAKTVDSLNLRYLLFITH